MSGLAVPAEEGKGCTLEVASSSGNRTKLAVVDLPLLKRAGLTAGFVVVPPVNEEVMLVCGELRLTERVCAEPGLEFDANMVLPHEDEEDLY